MNTPKLVNIIIIYIFINAIRENSRNDKFTKQTNKQNGHIPCNYI